MLYKIFPPIGIARIGDSKNEWFVGPEIPGAYQRPEGGYKSADCKIKRQGARFRIFAFDDQHNPILENGRPKEITLADGQITWEVQLGNIKASSHRFYQKLGVDGKPLVQRNPLIQPDDDRKKTLEIVTDLLTISGVTQQAVFAPGSFRGVPVPLGELRTDEAGRLIVLGGHGVSRRILPNGAEQFQTPNETYDNNDWHDDTSDGPVRAKLVIGGVSYPVTAARVIVAPPAFAPAIQPVVSLYDRMWEMMVEDFATDDDFKGQVVVPKPTFNRDIYPILRRGRDIAAVYDFQGKEAVHNQLQAAAADPAYFNAGGIVGSLRGPPGGPGAGGTMPKAIDDEKSATVALTRHQYDAMQAWAQGPGSGWINDWTGAPPTPNPFVTPDGMTRAALEACIGRGFRPGIEAGRFLFGIKTAHAVDYTPQDYDKPKYVEPFRLADDEEDLPPGKVTAMMAVPWQYDFQACKAEGALAWWPTHRPDKVYPEAGGGQTPWLASDDDLTLGDGKFLIDNLSQLGFVVEKAGKLVSTERRVGCRDLSVILARDPISRHQVDAVLKDKDPAKRLFFAALKVEVDGCTPTELDIKTTATTTLSLAEIAALAPQVGVYDDQGQPVPSLTVVPTAIKLQEANLEQAQIVSFTYDLTFADTTAFFDGQGPILARELTVAAVRGWHNPDGKGVASGDDRLTLTNAAHPFIHDGVTDWLAEDLRVFRVIEGDGPVAGADKVGGDAEAARTYIQKVVTLFNDTPPGPGHPFEKLGIDPDATKLRLASEEGNKPVFNFAVARVRNPSALADASEVRVFFRLFTTAGTGFAYDVDGPYRRTTDPDAPTPLLGVDGAGHVVTFPCFAAERVNSETTGLSLQKDPPNLRTVPAAPAGQDAGFAYFGCWIDNNQTKAQFPEQPTPKDGPWPTGRESLLQLVNGEHHCLVAEVAWSNAPIPYGATPGGDGRIAQRNLVWVESDNPGGPETRTIQHSFAIKAPSRDAGRLRRDELVIDWGGLPPGCRMSLYMPDLEATEVLRLATAIHDYTGLARRDAHTLDCLPGDITYVPIPAGRGRDIAALLTVELPEGIRKGQQFQVTVQQRDTRRRVQGTFQVNIPISVARAMLGPEKRRLSVLRYVALGKAPDDPWAAVLRRYIDQVAARVRAYGGDPDAIAPSPGGNGEAGKTKALVCRLLASLFALALAAFVLAGGLHPSPPWLPEIVTGLLTLAFGLLWLLVCKPPAWRLLLAAGAGAVLGAGLLGAVSLLGLGGPAIGAWLAVSALAGAGLLGLAALLKPKP